MLKEGWGLDEIFNTLFALPISNAVFVVALLSFLQCNVEKLPVASSVVWKMACNIHGGMERKRESDSNCNLLNVSRQTE